MNKKAAIEILKKPWRIPRYLWWRTGLEEFYSVNVRKRVSFSHEAVVSGWGVKGAGLPYFSFRLYQEVKALKAIMADSRFDRTLEVGCGYGRLLPWIMEYSRQHYAIEPEKKLYEDARKLYPAAQIYHAKAQALPFPDKYFDLCLTWTVLQHIPYDEQIRAAAEIKRVSKENAVIILTEGVGKFQDNTIWYRTLEGWEEIFSPWKLVKQVARVLEENAVDQGIVMRLEKQKHT